MKPDEHRVLCAAQWLYQYTSQDGFAGWLIRWVIPCGVLEHFNNVVTAYQDGKYHER
jgi:hypothetical protein